MKIAFVIARIRQQLHGIASTGPLGAWIFSLGLVVTLACLVAAGMRAHYGGIDEFGGAADDVRATMFVSGAGVPGGPSEMLLYSNRLIGLGLSKLYAARPDVPWYGIYLTSCQLVAHLVICFAWCRVSASWQLRFTIVAFSLAIGSLLWIYLQFTTTASLLAIAGASLLVSALIREGESERGNICFGAILCGWCCVGFAGLIRFHALLLVGFVLIPALLLLAVSCWKRIAVWKHITVSVIATATIFGLYGWSLQNFSDEPGWREFKEFEVPASRLINNRHATSLFFDQETLSAESEAALASVGWSHNDAKLFNYWLYFDENVYSVDAVSQLAPVATSVSASFSLWKKATLGVVRLFAVTPVCFLPALLSVVILVPAGYRSWLVGAIVWIGAVMLSAWLHLYLWLPPHVLFSIVATALFATVIISVADQALSRRNTGDRSGSRVGAVLFVVAMGLAFYKTWDHFREAQRGVLYRSEFFPQVDQLRKGPGNIYILVLQFPFHRVSPFDTMQSWDDWNFIYTDGDLRSPRYTAFLKEHRIDDLTMALYSDSRVQIVTIEEKMKLLVEFLDEHRGVKTEYIVTQELPSFKVYQLREKSSIWE